MKAAEGKIAERYIEQKRCCSGCAVKRRCSICDAEATTACADCAIDFRATIYVCHKRECRDAHDAKCPHQLKIRISAAEERERKLLASLSDPATVHTNILRGTIALTKAQAIHIAGLPADIVERERVLREALDKALAANERDRTALHRTVSAIDQEITGRMWLMEGRGSYEWDDDRYRLEFGWAIGAIRKNIEVLRKIAGDLVRGHSENGRNETTARRSNGSMSVEGWPRLRYGPSITASAMRG